MTPIDAHLDGFKQAFEDFVSHEAERAIAEATRDRDAHKQLWVVLYGDGRYALEHRFEDAPVVTLEPRDEAPISFPIEPLNETERDDAHLEDSLFERPIEAIWTSYRGALREHFARGTLSGGRAPHT